RRGAPAGPPGLDVLGGADARRGVRVRRALEPAEVEALLDERLRVHLDDDGDGEVVLHVLLGGQVLRVAVPQRADLVEAPDLVRAQRAVAVGVDAVVGALDGVDALHVDLALAQELEDEELAELHGAVVDAQARDAVELLVRQVRGQRHARLDQRVHEDVRHQAHGHAEERHAEQAEDRDEVGREVVAEARAVAPDGRRLEARRRHGRHREVERAHEAPLLVDHAEDDAHADPEDHRQQRLAREREVLAARLVPELVQDVPAVRLAVAVDVLDLRAREHADERHRAVRRVLVELVEVLEPALDVVAEGRGRRRRARRDHEDGPELALPLVLAQRAEADAEARLHRVVDRRPEAPLVDGLVDGRAHEDPGEHDDEDLPAAVDAHVDGLGLLLLRERHDDVAVEDVPGPLLDEAVLPALDHVALHLAIRLAAQLDVVGAPPLHGLP
ncbi:unnamed protein product, partial [Pelagomonas calceolata]